MTQLKMNIIIKKKKINLKSSYQINIIYLTKTKLYIIQYI